MAITVDYSVTPFLITIPQADLTLESGTRYTLDVDQFWLLLRDFSDNENAMAHPKLYRRIPATASTPSITEIEEAYYALQFENGLYSVNIVNGNTNIREVEVKNQVSVNTNNTTGFIDPVFLEYSTFDGGVWVDVANGSLGTSYPIGTPPSPSNNFSDALAIATTNGLKTVFVVGDATISGALNYSDYKFQGLARNLTTLNIDPSVNVLNATFEQATVTGTLDGDSFLIRCAVQNLSFVSGVILNCSLEPGTVALSGGVAAKFYDCESGLPGASTPVIDMGGSGQALAMRGYNGGIKLINKTGPEEVSIDLTSGQVKIDLTTVTNGAIIIRGTGKVVDDATGDWLPSGTYGSLTLVNETVQGQMLQELWKRLDMDKNSPNRHWKDSSRITNGADIDLVSTDNGDGTFTVQRQ